MTHEQFKGKKFQSRQNLHIWEDLGNGKIRLVTTGKLSCWKVDEVMNHDGASRNWPAATWIEVTKENQFDRLYKTLKDENI